MAIVHDMNFARFLVAAAAVFTLLSTVIYATPVPSFQDHAKAAANFMDLAKRGTSGFNDWNCRPSTEHPNPLVLVHATMEVPLTNWIYFGPRFVAEGYCVFALTYGQNPKLPLLYGVTKMESSAQELAVFADKVLNATGADKVDMLGHSQGSLMPRYWIKYLGGATKLRKFAGIASVQYGSTLNGIVPLAKALGLFDPIKNVIDPICEACYQFAINSTFINDLNQGGDTFPGIDYLLIATKMDEMVTPYTLGFLRDNNPRVHNQVLQDWCPFSNPEHVTIAYDPVVWNGLHAFFTPSADQTINCLDALN
ncbi:hypothetical protein FBU30_010695 [Linnemannia zychae]|nr:hypothetical protein FBU30_010695 [Linnemannia zychae]